VAPSASGKIGKRAIVESEHLRNNKIQRSYLRSTTQRKRADESDIDRKSELYIYIYIRIYTWLQVQAAKYANAPSLKPSTCSERNTESHVTHTRNKNEVGLPEVTDRTG